MPLSKSAVLLAFWAAFALIAPSTTRAQSTPKVAAVVVEGNRRVETDAIRAALSQKPNQPLDSKKIQADIKALMKLAFFSDVEVESRGPSDAPALVYRVLERPSVRSAKIVGNDELSDDDFKEVMEVKPFSILDYGAIRRTLKKISEKYVEKGYYLAEVKDELTPEPDNQVTVEFRVNEHAKVQIKSLNFIGLEKVKREDLAEVMQTREGGYLSFLTSSGTYREEQLQRDLQSIQAVYMERGYINVKVGKPSVELSPDKRFIFIAIRVEEGEQFRVGKIGLSGELLGDDEAVRKLVTLNSGEVFVRSKLGRDLFAIADYFHDKGYAYANITPLTNVDPKTRTIDLTFDAQPGQLTTFERIEITGNAKTRDKVIRRELRIYEGELYNGASINLSKQRVTALGYFQTVEIVTKKGSGDDKIIAVVEVKERPTGTFQVGAGFSSYENLIFTGQVSQNNLFGFGQTLSLSLQWSSLRQLGQIQFIEPYFLDTKWTFSFDLYATEGYYPGFVRKALGGSLTWGYELSGLQKWIPLASRLDDMRVFLTYLNERIDVRPSFAGQDLQLFNRFRSGTSSAVRLTWQWDKRDNRLFPTSGFFSALSAEFAPPALAPETVFGSAVNLYTRYTADLRFYRPLLLGLVGRVKVTGGYIRNWDENRPIPISEYYYLGGINSLRGYTLLSVAPYVLLGAQQRADTPLQRFQVGGNKQLIVNSEIEYPILPRLGIRGVVFYDMGNSFAPGSFSDPSVALSLYKSVGFGFRWFSPIGPLRFEWGIPLNRRRDPVTGAYLDRAVNFEFTIGNFF